MQHEQEVRRIQILCVEDEVDFLENIVEELTDAGFKALPAQSAASALETLSHTRPDLILCDVAMPGMDGYALLEKIRSQQPELADVPFVFLTAHSDPNQIAAGKWAGVDDYLVKPVDFDLLLATIHARLRQVARIHEQYKNVVAPVHNAMQQLHEPYRQTGTAQIMSALDHVSFGIILIDALGTIAFMNHTALQITDNLPGLIIDNRFVRSGQRSIAALGLAVEHALQHRSVEDDHYECVPLPRPDGARDLLCMVCGVPPHQQARPTDIAISIIVSDPAQRHALAPHMLESLFGLTPTEARVATAFAQGMRTADIAREFDISPTTVAFHKRNLFEKTQTRRQADLVALLLALPVVNRPPSFER